MGEARRRRLAGDTSFKSKPKSAPVSPTPLTARELEAHLLERNRNYAIISSSIDFIFRAQEDIHSKQTRALLELESRP